MSARLGTGVRRLLSTSTRHTRPTALPRTSPLTSTPTSRNTQAGPRHYSSMTGTDKKDKNDAVLQLVQKIIPPLHPTLHKGQAGRVGVLGGSGDYSGAPFFSAFGAMRFGADLAHVICEPEAGNVIKTYAPDLIVHGTLIESKGLKPAIEELKSVMERMHTLVIGPGLGRSEFMQGCAREALKLAKEMDIGIVIDADGLWLINKEPELVKDWPGACRVILTPNIMEFKRLCEALDLSSSNPEEKCAALAKRFGNVVIVQKGGEDRISHGRPLPPAFKVDGDTLVDSTQGGLKRVGGQGDILSGSTGTLLAWGRLWSQGTYESVGSPPDEELKEHVALLAAYGGSNFNRHLSRAGYKKMGRAMVTHDLLELIHPVYDEMFGAQQSKL